MLIKEKITRQEERVVGVICNKCGETIDSTWGGNHAQLFADWGYGSKKDGLMEESQICEKCYDEFTDSFIHPPTELR